MNEDLVVHSDGYYSKATGALVGFVVSRGGVVLASGSAISAELPRELARDSTAAEYWAIGFAARRAGALLDPGSRVLYRCDSQSVVEVLSGRARARGLYVPLIEWVLSGFGQSRWTLDWIPREQNRLADQLSRGTPPPSRPPRFSKAPGPRAVPRQYRIRLGAFPLIDIARFSVGDAG